MISASPTGVLVVAGGSGGHIFPAVGFLEQAAARWGSATALTFVTQKGKEALAGQAPAACTVVGVEAGRSVRGILRLFSAAWRLTGRLRPAWVVGFGGYMTVPFCLAARLRGCRVLLHEQNVVPGRANRFLSFFADILAASFEETRDHVAPLARKKVVRARFPLRRRLAPEDAGAARRSFGLDPSRFTLLVLGGSQGARKLNAAVPPSVERSGIGDRIQVLHLCGRGEATAVAEAYGRLRVPNRVLTFFEEMERVYSAADLAVSRAGSGVLHELLRFGVPAILIPYPYAGGHQAANAGVVGRLGAALVLEEARLEPGTLGQMMRILCTDGMRRKTMRAQAERWFAERTAPELTEIMS
ncbi:MAG: UDP-N-acetylglucosamine--N-acetylmuramyl-(pentapeptide) pyrophosphoryl-undecaprenol N-acetylglucosamine transferase [Deltaproteobacteria bacterium]